MSVIDSLVIELGLDARKFAPEAKKSVEHLRELETQTKRFGTGLETSGKQGADAFAGIRREAMALFAVFTAGKSLQAFIGDTTKANTQLAYMSQRLNMDPSGLYRLEAAAQAAGGSFGEVTQAFANLQQRMTDPQQWGQITRAFSQLGVSDFTDEHGRIRSDIIGRLNQGIHANHIDNAVATGYLRDLGFGEGAINEALMDPEKFRGLQRDASKVPTLTRQELENSRELYQSLSFLRQESQQYTNALVADLSPALTAVIRQFMDWEHEHPKVAAGIGGITLAVEELTKSFDGLGGVLVGLAGYKILKALGVGGVAVGSALGRGAGAGVGLLGRGYNATMEGAAGLVESGGAASAGAVLARLLGFGGVVASGIGISSEISRDWKTGNALYEAKQRGSVTNSPFFGILASSVAAIEHEQYDQMGGAGGKYAGKYQMSADAIRESAGQLGEHAPTQAQFLSDPAMQERYFKAYTKQNEWTLLTHSEKFRGMNDLQKLAVLGYAHNQGAGGATNLLKTGISRKDAFGTDGTRYMDEFMRESAAVAQRRSDRTNQTTVQTGDIVIHTQATDAKGIARDVGNQLSRHLSAINISGLQ